MPKTRRPVSTFSRSAPGTSTQATSSPAAHRPYRHSRTCGVPGTTLNNTVVLSAAKKSKLGRHDPPEMW